MRWSKLVRYGALALALLQFPFVVRVCNSYRLERFVAEHVSQPTAPVPFDDLRGSLHVHSAAGSHSMGTYREIIQAAKQAGFGYLLLTDHPKEYVLFNRMTDPDLVVLYGVEEERADGGRVLRDENSRVRVYSTFTGDAVPADVTAIEIFNMAEAGRPHNNLSGWLTWIYHRLTIPELFFVHFLELDAGRLALWDRESARRPLAAFAGNNAHQNLGLIVVSGTGKRLASVFVDPYVDSFRFVTNHLQLPAGPGKDAEAVLHALETGASYVCFERMGDPTGFSFHAETRNGIVPMGSRVDVGTALVLQSPYPVRFRLIRSGKEAVVLEGARFVYEAKEPGTYRVEAYHLDAPSLIAERPWILSNPIYVGGVW